MAPLSTSTFIAIVLIVKINSCNSFNCTQNGIDMCQYQQMILNQGNKSFINTLNSNNNKEQQVPLLRNSSAFPIITSTVSPVAISMSSPPPIEYQISLYDRTRLFNEMNTNKTALFKSIIKRDTKPNENINNDISNHSHVVSYNDDANHNSNYQNKVIDENTSLLDSSTTTNEYETILFLNESNPNRTFPPCDEYEDNTCTIDHEKECIGLEQYCNLTYEEYFRLVYDYIKPSNAEWVLIVSHALVFTMGLVSTNKL